MYFAKSRLFLLYIALCLFVVVEKVQAENPLLTFESLEHAAMLVVDDNGRELYARNANEQLIPASTIKLLTAIVALQHWGPGHRFGTKFAYQHDSKKLWVKGLGDPYLVSEEIDLIVAKIKQEGISKINAISVDDSFFSKPILLDGRGRSNNPYDAPYSPLAANFNSIQVQVNKSVVTTGEQQTPVTSTTYQFAKRLGEGNYRVNLIDRERSTRYFIEVLVSKLVEQGVQVVEKFDYGTLPVNADINFEYKNSRQLDQILEAMLKHSNNFIANQVYLKLGADVYSEPASPQKSARVFAEFIQAAFDWSDYTIMEGSGLSRKNQLSVRQIIDVLKMFSKQMELLPSEHTQIYAKSGSLSGVRAYAGYLSKDGDWQLFAMIINQAVEHRFRERLAEYLLEVPLP